MESPSRRNFIYHADDGNVWFEQTMYFTARIAVIWSVNTGRLSSTSARFLLSLNWRCSVWLFAFCLCQGAHGKRFPLRLHNNKKKNRQEWPAFRGISKYNPKALQTSGQTRLSLHHFYRAKIHGWKRTEAFLCFFIGLLFFPCCLVWLVCWYGISNRS